MWLNVYPSEFLVSGVVCSWSSWKDWIHIIQHEALHKLFASIALASFSQKRLKFWPNFAWISPWHRVEQKLNLEPLESYLPTRRPPLGGSKRHEIQYNLTIRPIPSQLASQPAVANQLARQPSNRNFMSPMAVTSASNDSPDSSDTSLKRPGLVRLNVTFAYSCLDFDFLEVW